MRQKVNSFSTLRRYVECIGVLNGGRINGEVVVSSEAVEMILTLVGVGAIALIGVAITMAQQKKLEDPHDATVIDVDEIPTHSLLQEGGKYLVRTYRQSGELQKADQKYEQSAVGLKAIVTTLKRAKISHVVVEKNTSVEMYVRRPYHSHKGTNEGRKVGRIEIYKVA